jgi:hypothetical protein
LKPLIVSLPFEPKKDNSCEPAPKLKMSSPDNPPALPASLILTLLFALTVSFPEPPVMIEFTPLPDPVKSNVSSPPRPLTKSLWSVVSMRILLA